MKRFLLAAIAALLALVGCMPQPPGVEPRIDPNPGVHECRDTDKPGYQRACIEVSTYCGNLATPFDFTIHIQATGLDGQLRRWTDEQTGEQAEINLNFTDSTKLTADGDQAILIIAVDYPFTLPPSLLMFAALSGATATKGCDAFLALSSPQTRLHPHGTGLFGSGAEDQDYFLAEEDFVPMALMTKLEIPYLLPEVR
jgi:hypothetical protein